MILPYAQGMMWNNPDMIAQYYPMLSFLGPWIIIGILFLTIWDLVWKGISLWKSGRNNQLVWFIALLLVNSIGVLPIIYLLWFQKKEVSETGRTVNPTRSKKE